MTPHAPLAPRRAAVALAVAATVAAAPVGAAPAPLDAFGASPSIAEAALGSHALRLLDGSGTTLASHHGEVLVVNFWATWCTPCRRELPRLDALSRDAGLHRVRVIAVSIDGDRENVRRFARAARLTLAIASDGPDGLAKELDLKHVPATVVLDRDGRIAWSTGRSDDAELDRLDAVVRRLAAAPVASADAGEGVR